MAKSDVPPVSEEPREGDAPALEPKAPRDDWSKIAGGTTYITGEPSFPRTVYNYFDMVLKKHIVSGYDNRISTEERDMMVQELLEVLALVMPLGGRDDADYAARERKFREIATRMVYAEDPLLVVPILTNIVAQWIDRSRFGLPPTTKSVAWDLTPEEAIKEGAAELAAKIEVKRRAKEYVRP